jgi:L-lysine exporter family protein LysE/ArgO
MQTPAVTSAFATGFALMAALIIAIGAQNAFVLRQGLVRRHVGLVVGFCATADALLMIAGVLGAGAALQALPGLARALAWAGAAFLFAYGLRAFARALRPGTLSAAADAATASRGAVLAQVAAFTLLNPHVYLDTVMLAGSIGAQQPAGAPRTAFIIGSSAASAAWFATLGYGARALAPWFARPAAWRVLDAIVGATMLAIAAGLVLHALRA